ncbi:phytanoyl-CoA dioxygenase domain-containing protein 1-like [Gigantopelta aegis]|uniref:phytanoyl-CoA dioxygenase domain-containing protein 1-like n=1 Tax=Gigantopelta aegis TaxID=1735272 RepID=UPI001B889A77|nr:phytanoyl-CoA dioxygenase domain-containing protein 1-like [Gigantopelta aegis]
MKTIDKDFVKFFDENGYQSGIDVLNSEETQDLKKNFNAFEEKIGKGNTQYSLHNIHVEYPWVLKVATHPKMLAPLQAILGQNLILLDSRFICKYTNDEVPVEEGVEPFVAWHQDIRYWGVDGDVVSVWLAVDDADLENGCMLVIPATHKSGILTHNQAKIKGNLLSTNQEIPPDLYDKSKAIPCPLKAGQMSLHHGHIVHGSEPNRSNRRRCGFVIRYIATTAYPIKDENRPRKFPTTVLVSGKDEHKNFEDHSPEWFDWRK